MKTTIITILSIVLFTTTLFAHGDKEHEKKTETTTLAKNTTDAEHDHASHSHESNKTNNGHDGIKADFDDFATLHPLVVHFPIVLLLFAAIIQLISCFKFSEELSWVVLGLTLFGFIGAYVAGEFVHPHTSGLSDFAKEILEEHEEYADFTVWFGGIALLFKIVSHFVFKRKLWSEIMVTCALIGAAYFVSEAGHYGAQLIHIEGVGAAGKNIETEHHEH